LEDGETATPGLSVEERLAALEDQVDFPIGESEAR
jgi:hypothetical protein